jgi:hypothetical protein
MYLSNFVSELAGNLASHPALLAHVSGPLARKASRAENAPNTRKGRAKRSRCIEAICRVQQAQHNPPKPAPAPAVDLAAPWTLETARVAFRQLAASGQTQTAFGKAHGFNPSRFRRWAGRVAEVN